MSYSGNNHHGRVCAWINASIPIDRNHVEKFFAAVLAAARTTMEQIVCSLQARGRTSCTSDSVIGDPHALVSSRRAALRRNPVAGRLGQNMADQH
jgi:hypothetical protein